MLVIAGGAIALIVSFFIWAFFLNASGVTIPLLIEFSDLQVLASKLISLNFIAFLVFFSLSYSILVALAKIIPKRELQGTSAGAFAFSGLVFWFVFPFLQNFFVLGVFYLISLIVVVETAFIKFSELKSFVVPRTAIGAISQGLFVIGIGVFVSTLLFVLPAQERIVQDFEKNLFSSFTPKEVKEDYSKAISQVIVQSQTEVLGTIAATPVYQSLSVKEDPDVIAFVTTFNAVDSQIKSQEYRQELEKRLAKSQEENLDQTGFDDLIEQTKQRIPVFSLLEQFFWLFASFAIISLFFLASNILIKPTGAVFGTILITITEMISKIEKEPPEEPLSQKDLAEKEFLAQQQESQKTQEEFSDQ